MDLGYSGRVAVVTGGTSGIGLATARLLIEEGARVAICGRDATRLAVAAAQLTTIRGADAVLPVRCDVLDKAAVAQFAGQLGFSATLKNFMYVLIDHRRTAMLGEILASLESQLDGRRGIVRASVQSTWPLDEAQRREIEAALGRTTGKQVSGVYEVDDALIGGLVARVGSVVYDGSVRGQLQAMRDRLVRS